MKTASELFDKVLKMTTDELYCTLPCQVVAVENNHVDVKVFINDDEPDMILYHVPIQRPETQRAYIYLGIKSGDRGTLKFFDRSVEGYLQSDFDYNSDDRQHDISDRAFELGFIPDKEAYVYPSETQTLPVDEILPNFNSDDFNTKLTDEEEYGSILRAKGIVQAEDGRWLHFDYVPGETEIRYGSADYTGRLCVIGTHIDESALHQLFGV